MIQSHKHMELINTGLMERVRITGVIEARCENEIWKEGGPCPASVGGLPCEGTLSRFETGSEIIIYCSSYPTSHTLEIPKV